MIARRLSGVMRHTSHGKRDASAGTDCQRRNAAAAGQRQVAARPEAYRERRSPRSILETEGTSVPILHCRSRHFYLEDYAHEED